VQLWQSPQLNKNLNPYELNEEVGKSVKRPKTKGNKENFVIPQNDLNMIKNITSNYFLFENTTSIYNSSEVMANITTKVKFIAHFKSILNSINKNNRLHLRKYN
jgi:hypothetical protein